MRRCLIIVAKEPAVGRTKTRLAAGVGAIWALELYRSFLLDTLDQARHIKDCTLAFSFWPPEAAPSFRALYVPALLLPQRGEDFGSRLLSAFEQASKHDFDQMVLIGSDNPSLPRSYVEQAFAALDEHETVLGPSTDGGYYLIGMRRPQPALFHRGIAWSTEVVAEQTRDAATANTIGMTLIPPWYDIDTAADLRLLYRDLVRQPTICVAPRTREVLAEMADSQFADLLELEEARPF
ncbi:MAG: TIGR04282 family arsenosugar biosynthesis glycosyltransferase [Roseiflexaceae bacterium]|nr:TIGR04282 family arsenosugar biosynthesis glycosyltransferase [Roseiflexaceae bacterium]